MLKKLFKVALLFSILSVSFSQLYIENSLSASQRPTVLPIGGQDIIIYRLVISSDADDEWKEASFQILDSSFPSNWAIIKIYKDVNLNGTLDASEKNEVNDTESDVYTTSVITINSLYENFDISPTQAYFIAVNISETADVDAILQITPNEFINSIGEIAVLSSNIRGYSFNLGRLYSVITTTLTTDYFIGDNEMELFNVELRLSNDSKCKISFDFNVDYANENEGIGYIRIYQNDYPTTIIASSELKSSSNFVLTLPDDSHNLVRTTSKSFSIRYYNDNYSNTGLSFNVAINDIIGSYISNGAKGYIYKSIDEKATTDIQLAGVYPAITKTPTNSEFVGGEIPVFHVQLSSYYITSNLNTFELVATGDFHFSNVNSSDVIQKVLIYRDNVVILTVSVGEYDIIDEDTIKITVNSIIQNFFVNEESLVLTISYVLTNSVSDASSFETRIRNITYFTGFWVYHDLDNLFLDEVFFKYNMQGEAIVRMNGYFVTSNHKINFPRGGDANQIAYFDFSYKGVPVFDSMVRLDTFIIENNSILPIDKLNFYLVHDLNRNKVIDSSDAPTIKVNINKEYDLSSNRVTINNAQILLINDAPSKAYFLMMEIASTADTGLDNVSLEVPNIYYYREFKSITDEAKPVIYENLINNSTTISVTGLIMTQEKRDFSLPYRQQDSFVLATFSVISLVRLTSTLNFDLEIKTNSSLSLGTLNIVKNYSGGSQEDNTIVTISVTDRVNNNNDPYSYSLVTYDHNELTRNYKVIYYPNNERDAGSTFDVIIKNIKGTGYENGYETPCFSDNLTASVGLAGLRVSLDSAIVSGNFIDNMDIPVFRCGYSAFYDNITFNGLTLMVSQNSFLFTMSSDENRIKEVNIYRDSNNNKVWDHDDRLLNVYLMDDQKLTEKYITINELAISGSVYNDLFFVFDLSTHAAIDDNIIARSSIEKYHYTLSGDTQVITVNKQIVQNVTLSSVKYVFTPGSDLFPTTNLEGSYDLPILSFKLRSNDSNNFTTYNFYLETNKDFYSNNDLGIKTVKLIEDVDNSNTYTSKDKVIDTKTDFTNVSRRITFNINDLYYNDRSYLVLYTLGQKMSDIPNISSEILRPKIYIDLVSTSSAKTAGLFPYPRNNRYMSFTTQGIVVELVSLTPNNWTTGNLSITLKVANSNPVQVTVNSIYPQFYEASLSSLNVTYLYNVTTTLNFPFTLNISEQKVITYTITSDIEFKKNNLFLDALAEYETSLHKVRLQRQDLFGWQRLVSAKESVAVDLPEASIFYMDYPTYIKQIIRSRSGIEFLNDDIIGNDEYLIIYLKDTLSNLDTSKMKVFLDAVSLNMYSSEPNYKYDTESNSIIIGDFAKGMHTLKLMLYDNAGNMYPEANLMFSVYDSDQFYIKDLLVYPTRKTRDSITSSPLKIGYQLSKSCEVKLYLFNSRGESVWSNSFNASLADNYYQLLDFNGTLNNGTLIPKGMYILKAIIIDNGKKIDAKTTTKFIIY